MENYSKNTVREAINVEQMKTSANIISKQKDDFYWPF